MDIPEQYRRTVIPHIMVKGAADAIEFYKTAFNATEHFRLEREPGHIIHAEVAIEGSTFMLGDAEPPLVTPDQAGVSVVLHIYVDDVDTITRTATSGGAELLAPPTDMPYGARQSMLRDPFGHVWILLTPLDTGGEDVS